jgi:hypothetical protein
MPIGSSLRSAFSLESAPQHPDRRQSPRYDMSGGVYRKDGTEPSKIGTVRDISLGGAYVFSQDDLPTEKLLTLQFKMGADFEMSGYIRRKDRNGFAIVFEAEA